MTTRKKYRVALVEPSDIVCAGLKTLLTDERGFEIVSTAADARQWAAFPKSSPAEVILVNPSVLARHERQNVRQSLQIEPHSLVAALVYNYCRQEELAQYECVIDIADAKDTIAKKIRLALENRTKETPANPKDNAELSDREKEILTCLVEGHTNKEIAAIYNLSVHTVISHRKNISRKTGIKTVSGLTVYALLNHLVKTDDVE